MPKEKSIILIGTHVDKELRDRIAAAAKQNARSIAGELRYLVSRTYAPKAAQQRAGSGE